MNCFWAVFDAERAPRELALKIAFSALLGELLGSEDLQAFLAAKLRVFMALAKSDMATRDRNDQKTQSAQLWDTSFLPGMVRL